MSALLAIENSNTSLDSSEAVFNLVNNFGCRFDKVFSESSSKPANANNIVQFPISELDKQEKINISKPLYPNDLDMEEITHRQEQEPADIPKKDEQLLEHYCKEIQAILETNPELKLSEHFAQFFSREITKVLGYQEPTQKSAEVCLNDLGLPMHGLEVEVADMIEQVKQGNRVFPVYNRVVDQTPLKYLEKYYGKYLKAFNKEEDYLYQHQLQAIDAKFRNNLRTWLDRNGKNVNDYIPTKSKLIDKEYEQLKTISLNEVQNKKKLFNLIQAKKTQKK